MKARKESKKVRKLRSRLRRADAATESLHRKLDVESRRRQDAEAALRGNESEPGYAVIRIGKNMPGMHGERLGVSLAIDTFELLYSIRGQRQPFEIRREVAYYCMMLTKKMEQGLMDYIEKHGI